MEARELADSHLRGNDGDRGGLNDGAAHLKILTEACRAVWFFFPITSFPWKRESLSGLIILNKALVIIFDFSYNLKMVLDCYHDK